MFLMGIVSSDFPTISGVWRVWLAFPSDTSLKSGGVRDDDKRITCMQNRGLGGCFSGLQETYLMKDRLRDRSNALHLEYVSSSWKLNLGREFAESRKLRFKAMRGLFDQRIL